MLTIQAIMEAKYPEADFGEYFRFLVSCAGTLRGLTHEHHIAPRKQFPELAEESENFITLTVTDHANAHKLLEYACGIKSPPTLYFEVQHEASVTGGRKGGLVAGPRSALTNEKNCTGLYDPKVRALGCCAAALVNQRNRTAVYDPKVQLLGASARGKSCKENKKGIFSADYDRGRTSRRVNHIRFHVNRRLISAECEFCRTR